MVEEKKQLTDDKKKVEEKKQAGQATPVSAEKKGEFIEIPVGKFFNRVRENPWIITTVVLAVVVIVMIVTSGGSNSGTGKVILGGEAAQNAIAFLKSNPQLQGDIELVSVQENGPFYTVVLSYLGQQVPVYLTLDGEYLLTGAPISLSDKDIFNSDTVNADDTTPVDVSEDDDAVLGDENAPVTIIEFSDYQCPFCAKFWSDTLPQIKENYIDTGKVKLIYRDFPLDIHPMAEPAAEAAECVKSLGGDSAYYEYHDLLFENQDLLSNENLVSWASDLGYDIESCFNNADFKDEVLKDFQDGQDVGVSGTPAFFVNGIKLEGALPYAQFKQVIDSFLEEQQ